MILQYVGENTMAENDSQKQAKRIGLAVILGLVVGMLLYWSGHSELSMYTKPVGVIFIRLLKMIIIPLIFSSVFIAILNLGSPENLGKMGKRAIIYYTVTTSIAVLIGLIYVNIFTPGIGTNLVSQQKKESAMKSNKTSVPAKEKAPQKGLVATIVDVMVTAIPTNPVKAMATNNMLQVIVFAMLFGLVALYYQKEAGPVTQLINSIEFLSQKLTVVIMNLAPFGVFALMIDVVSNAGIDALLSLGKYMLVVMLGLLTHSTLLVMFGASQAKKSPLFIVRGMGAAILTAFSTSSSAATLPVTLNCVQDNLKCSEKTANFVLPLGATINMDGTALYVSVATVFIAQVYGIELTLAQNAIIFVTASLAAVGAAAIPGAGLITMGIVLSAANLPIEGIQVVIAVDRILDMFRTTTNVLGDSVGCVVVDSLINKEEAKASA
jgi:proton glutamate symport protein